MLKKSLDFSQTIDMKVYAFTTVAERLDDDKNCSSDNFCHKHVVIFVNMSN